jgi:hypothetical protein
MKKLMIAGIAGLCAAVSFGIESDVVGYAENATVNGFTIVTPQFQNFNDANFSLLNFTAGDDMYDNLTVNQIDEFGTSIHTYTWTTSADDGTSSYDKIGWADDDYMIVTDPAAVAFIPGESLMVAAGAGAIQSAGKVRLTDATVQLRNGFTLAGNPYPVNVNVADILPSSKSGTIDDTYDQITLNLIDEFGTAIHTYTWTTSADDGTSSYDKIGWADDDYMIINESNVKTLTPGQGVLVTGTTTDHYITFPAVEF